MLYFAYASNMSSRQMIERIGTYQNLGRACLDGWQFGFNKRSIDGTAKANIVRQLGSTVWGVLYDISSEAIARLDSHEKGYSHVEVAVVLDSGVVRQAACYAAEITEPGLFPSRDYLATILNGAEENNLPNEYIKFLRESASR